MINSAANQRLVRCTVGGDTFFLDSDWLDSIQVIENLYPSRSADGSIGWIRRFDEKVPVFRLADQIYGNKASASRQGVIMVLRRNEKLWAMVVDKVAAAGDISAERIYPLPAIAGADAGGIFSSAIVDEEGIILHLSAERLEPGQTASSQAPRKQSLGAPAVFSRVRTSIARAATAPVETEAVSGQKAGLQLITFSLLHEAALEHPVRFAVTASQALEIASGLPITPVPHAPAFLTGLAKWRSMPVPVVDLAAWLGLPPAPFQPGSRLLICRGTTGRNHRDAGLLAVASVDDIRKLDLPIDYKPWPKKVNWNSSLALGIYRTERTMMVVPDLDAILSFQSEAPAYAM
ncbi:MAG: chemotaxis protein CheW [Bryobacterales bacterium]|nr:chemotaxis protein CheW [Bryobacterales bacterium]